MQSLLLSKRLMQQAHEFALSGHQNTTPGQTLVEGVVPPPNDAFLVKFDQNSPEDPHNWRKRKWLVLLMVANLSFGVGVASSINSQAAPFAASDLGVSEEVIALDTALFLIGFGVSSPFLAPLSELGGRNPVYFTTVLVFTLFQIGAALSPNIQARCILRFFSGMAGSTPLSNAGGTLSDVFSADERTIAFPIYAGIGLCAPALGPVIGGFIGESYLGYKWCDWVSAIWGGATLVIILLFMPETLGSEILKLKARAIRQATGDQRYETALERLRRTSVTFKEAFSTAAQRPFLMLVKEPIVVAFCFYMSFVYIVLFGNLVAYPFIFEKPYGLSVGVTGLTFIPLALGILLVTGATPILAAQRRRAVANTRRHLGPNAVPPPEERLRLAMFGTWLMPVSLFMAAWTTYRSATIWPVLISQGLFGVSIMSCFISSYQYIIDAYSQYAASALSVLTFVRYVVSGAAVMFTGPMFKTMGRHWAMTLLACLSTIFCFIPYLFAKTGPTIRSWSSYAPDVALEPVIVVKDKDIDVGLMQTRGTSTYLSR
ncbi:hypothetical protein OIO90_000061 [Microbotryomycetes sp. JL221]|nr:hypothetical protein OIO90_000061 [Microbotryomycetes sp. JL221]